MCARKTRIVDDQGRTLRTRVFKANFKRATNWRGNKNGEPYCKVTHGGLPFAGGALSGSLKQQAGFAEERALLSQRRISVEAPGFQRRLEIVVQDHERIIGLLDADDLIPIQGDGFSPRRDEGDLFFIHAAQESGERCPSDNSNVRVSGTLGGGECFVWNRMYDNLWVSTCLPCSSRKTQALAS